MRSLFPLVLFAVGCHCSSGPVVPDDTAPPTDDTGPIDDGPLVAGDWWVHPEVESLVYVSWEQSEAGQAWVEYSFDEGEWRSSPPFEATAGAHEQVLVGIPYYYDVRWRVVAEWGGERFSADGAEASAGSLPDGLPVGEVTVSEPGLWEPTGNYLLSSIAGHTGSWDPGNYFTFIVDRRGRPVWASLAPERHWTLFAQISVDGHTILWDESTYWLDWGQNGGEGTTIHRTHLDVEVEEIPADGIVHAFVELPDGTLAWGSEYHVPQTEALVELAPGADEVEVIWTCEDDYPGSRNAYCSSNGLFYEASTDSYLYSFWDESVVVEVDGATGENLWWAGGVRDGYAFEPEESQFEFQHGVSYTDAGTLLLHSGGYGMSAVQMAREYEVDHGAQTLREVWSYGLDEGEPGGLNGDVWRLAGGNTLHTLGSGGMVKEIAPDGQIVWFLDFGSERLMGRSTLIEDLWELVAPRE
jgi:hypothetical protein